MADTTKTTVYLPVELKRALRQAAETTGRSEAEVIRSAIAAELRSVAPPRPRGGLFASGDSTRAERVDELLVGFGER